ncbi:MAG TPA: penicillin-binding transpeptidase domain-containing protein, partial [Synergistales bacterium]|nr:penicillin-binding transpeptidase domain-containing protein [Synergistales bacterium]
MNGAYGGGLHVYTMLDPDLQEAGERIAARSKHQLAIVGLDSETGGVRALVGGKDWHVSQFDRAVQAYRQPGSAFKPLVYATLFEKKGWSGATKIQDAPISFGSGRNRWSPRNYDGKFRGSVTVERAIIGSLNVPAVRALSAVGAGVVAETVRSMGITTPYLPDNPTMALGSASLTPLEMAAAFSVFGNGGYRIVPTLVREIRDADGKVLFKAAEEKKRVLSEYTANGIRDILIKAVSSGTGRAARIDGFQVFGKTGTTNDFRDAWFVGGIPGFCAAVYVGDDDRKPLGKGATGGKIAAPIWQDFMEYAADTLCAPAAFPKNTEKTPPVPRERGTQETTDPVKESETASPAPPKETPTVAPPQA